MEAPDTETASAVGLGIIGGGLATLFGKRTLTGWQKFGSVLAGGVCSYVFTPIVPLLWTNAPPSVVGASGFIFGLGSLFIIMGLLTWLDKAERRMPRLLDRRFGFGQQDDPTPLPPVETTKRSKPPGDAAENASQPPES